MKSEVFNSSIGAPYDFTYPNLDRKQQIEIIAGFFEQLLIFDKITISTNRLNFALVFLIGNLGINTVERLIDSGYIKFMIWTPVILTSSGRQLENGKHDPSAMYGVPPIIAGRLSDEDMDPEHNIAVALSKFALHPDRKRIFTKKILKNYLVPDGMEFSSDSTKFIIDAYQKNNLESLGLPYEREPEQLHIEERQLLLSLGHKVIETSLLSKHNLKSYENYEHYAICKQNFQNIGKAYNIADNTEALFKLEGLPNLKQLFIDHKLDFDSVFKIRHLSNAKYYRKWINAVGEDFNAEEITREYLNQLKGNSTFFESTGGKFLKHLTLFGAGTALGAAFAAPIEGALAGYSLGLLDTFWLDNFVKGKKPSMFIDDIKPDVNNQKV